MNNIEQMHLDAIKNSKNDVAFNIFGTMIYTVDESLAATEATKVTEQIAIEFTKFCLNKAKDLDTHTVYHNIDNAFQEFLKTK